MFLSDGGPFAEQGVNCLQLNVSVLIHGVQFLVVATLREMLMS